MRPLDVTSLVVFAAVVCAPVAMRVVAGPSELDENARATEAPSPASLALLEQSSLDQLVEWTDEQVAMRDTAVDLTGAAARVLGDSPNDGVVIGVDGWLFSPDEFTAACETTDPAVQELVRARLAELRGVIEASGRRAVLAVAPDKSAVFPELTGASVEPLVPCLDAADAFYRSLEAEGVVVPLREELDRRKASGEDIYFAYDTHWARPGGIVLSEAVVDALDPGLWEDDAVVPSVTKDHVGDLSRLLGTPTTEPEQRFAIERDATVARQETASRDITVYRADGTSPLVGGSIALRHDSFMWAAMAILNYAEHVVGIRNLVPTTEGARGPVLEADTIIYERVQRGVVEDLVHEDGVTGWVAALAQDLAWTPLDELADEGLAEVFVALHLDPPAGAESLRIEFGEWVTELPPSRWPGVSSDGAPLVVRVPGEALEATPRVTSGREVVDLARVVGRPTAD